MAWCSQPIELTANIVDSDHLQHPIWPMEKHICVLPCNQIEFGTTTFPAIFIPRFNLDWVAFIGPIMVLAITIAIVGCCCLYPMAVRNCHL